MSYTIKQLCSYNSLVLLIICLSLLTFQNSCGRRKRTKSSYHQESTYFTRKIPDSKQGDKKTDNNHKPYEIAGICKLYIDEEFRNLFNGLIVDEIKSQCRFLRRKLGPRVQTVVKLKSCNRVNAYYSLKNKEIVICSELVKFVREVLSEGTYIYECLLYDYDYIGSVVKHVLGQIFLHEVAHMLYDRYKLPVSGNEEEMADFFATWLFVEQKKSHEVLLFALFFKQLSSISYSPPWDVHRPHEVRVFDLRCWVYGSDEQEYQFLLGDCLPHQRAIFCRESFLRNRRAWKNEIIKRVKY